MRHWILHLVIVSFVIGFACYVQAADDIDDLLGNLDGDSGCLTEEAGDTEPEAEIPKVTVPVGSAKTKVAVTVVVPPAAVVPVAVSSGSTEAGEKKATQKKAPPPEPPAADAAEPRRLVRYFCRAWKDEEWERLWWTMTPKYRKKVPLKKFRALFTEDAELNGGLKDENIADVTEANSGMSVKVELQFKFRNAKPRVVDAVVERIVGGQYRIKDSAIIPVDLNDL